MVEVASRASHSVQARAVRRKPRDSALAYVANAGSNNVSVVDMSALREVTRIPVGQVPKRNITAMLP